MLRWFWSHRDHYSEALNWYQRVLALDNQHAKTKGLALALLGAGEILQWRVYYHESHAYLNQSLAIWREMGDLTRQAEAIHWIGWQLAFILKPKQAYEWFESNGAIIRQSNNPQDLATCLSLWGIARANAGSDLAAARALIEEGISLAKQWQDANALGITLMHRGHMLVGLRDLDGARQSYLEAVASQRLPGTQHDIAMSLWAAGGVLYVEGDYARARTLLDESKMLFEAVGDRVRVAYTNGSLACLEALKGNHSEASILLADTLKMAADQYNRWRLTTVFLAYAILSQSKGQIELSVRLLAYAVTLSISALLEGVGGILRDRYIAAARAELDPAVFDAAWAAGSALTLEQAIALALRDNL